VKVAARMWYSNWEQSTASTIFHGIDWDFEENDNRSSLTLDAVGEICRLMKEQGYVVIMAPPQSYLNFNTSEFSRYVNLTIPGRRWHADLVCFGNNVHVDLVLVHLCESYLDAAMTIYHNSVHAEKYLYLFVLNLAIGDHTFYVDLFQDNDLKEKFLSRFVKMKLSKLVIELGNGWAAKDYIPWDQRKALFVPAEDCLCATTD
jgi:beta-glucosidase